MKTSEQFITQLVDLAIKHPNKTSALKVIAIQELKARESYPCVTLVGKSVVYLRDGTKVVLSNGKLSVEQQSVIKPK